LPNPFLSTLRAADGRLPSLPRLPLDQLAGAQSRRDDRAGREARDAARLANAVGALVDGPTDSWLRGQPARWIMEPRRLPEQEHMDGSIGWTDTAYALTQIERRATEVDAPLGAATTGQPRPTL
jgi:hypothetical protein